MLFWDVAEVATSQTPPTQDAKIGRMLAKSTSNIQAVTEHDVDISDDVVLGLCDQHYCFRLIGLMYTRVASNAAFTTRSARV